MARSYRDNFQSPDWRLREPARPEEEPPGLPEGLRLFPSPDLRNPFGPPPKIQPQRKPLDIWEYPPISPAPAIPPLWPVMPLPSPETNPFPDPSIPRLPVIPPSQQTPPYDLDPSNFPGQGRNEPGSLLGNTLTMMPQGQIRPDAGPVAAPNGAREVNVDNYGGPQGGLLGRLLALQAEQSGYQPIPEAGEWPSSQASDPNFRRLARIPNDTPMSGSAAPYAMVSAPLPASQQSEADQAQKAREAAAARLVQGVRSRARAEAPPPDPVDIAKSAGIGFINGGVNAVGLPADAMMGFGYLPNNYFTNLARRTFGSPDSPPDEPDFFKQYGSDAIRRGLEKRYGEFYKPNTTVGRFAETIGEMTPMVLAGGLPALLRTSPARAGLHEVFGTLAKHAVAPGIAVQTLEEALPDSGAGEALQKGYPVARRVLPAVLAGKRYYLRRRVTPQ